MLAALIVAVAAVACAAPAAAVTDEERVLAYTRFRALFDAGINIELITTSEIRLTCLIDAGKVPDAVRALHAAFELEKPE